MSTTATPAAGEQAPQGAPPDGGPARTSGPRWRRIAGNNFILIALGLFVLLFSLLEPDAFFTTSNFQIILGSQAVLVMLALALTVALTANEFDLSVGAVMGACGVWLATLTATYEWSLALAIPVVMLTALAIGALNAALTVWVGINSFIVTLGTGSLITGFAFKLTDSAVIAGLPVLLSDITVTKIFGVQVIFFYAIGLALVLWYVLEHTPLGRWTTFVGSGPEVARLNGLPVNGIRAGALVLSAVIAGAAGILNAGALGSADPNAGTSFLLPAFAAAFLGATTIKPGRLNVWGTTLAVYLVIVGIVGLQVTTGASGWIVNVFNGGVLIVAVAMSRLLGHGSGAKP